MTTNEALPRSIVIPIYSHTSEEEIRDILEALRGIGIDGAYVHAPIEQA